MFVAYLVIIEWWLGWAALLSPWRELSLPALLVALLLFVLTYALRAQRLYDYFRDAMRGRWPTALRLMVYHNALNNLLPMRSGELSFPLLMKSYFAIPYSTSVPALLWFRLLDLHSILLIGGLAVVGPVYSWLVALPLALAWISLPYLVFRARAPLRRALLRRPAGRLPSLLLKALEGLPDNHAELWRSWALTWANWLLKLVVLAWVLLQFIDVTRPAAMAAVIGGELTSILPFHAPGGVGTYEAGIVAALLPFSVEPKAATNAAVNAHLFVLAAALASAGTAMLIPRRRSPG